MSTRNIYDDDDECDSSFVYRNRQAIIFKNDSTIKQEVNIDEPLNLSLKPRIHDTLAINVKEEVRELNKENENDLTELGWLTSYNIKKDLNINNFGNLSPEYGVDDEADSGGRALNSCIPASFLQNMLAPHSKPSYSYSCLIFMSIESSIRKRLTVKEIYSWVLSNFPYFNNIPSGSWKNSIRHNLSHNKCFKKVDKNLLACRDFSGKGSLWCVNPEYRMVLIETMKKTPQKAFSILQDIPESMGLHIYKTPSLVASRRFVLIFN
jgi:forkhead box protein N